MTTRCPECGAEYPPVTADYNHACDPDVIRDRTVAAVVDYLKDRLDNYPLDVFPEPPRGEHGSTIDACSARAMRFVLGSCIRELESGYWCELERRGTRPESDDRSKADG